VIQSGAQMANRKAAVGVGQALEDVFMWRTPGDFKHRHATPSVSILSTLRAEKPGFRSRHWQQISFSATASRQAYGGKADGAWSWSLIFIYCRG
jgi:hypothetical protein